MTRQRVPEERNLQTHLHETSRFTQEWRHGRNKIFYKCCTAALTSKVRRLILQLNDPPPQNRNLKKKKQIFVDAVISSVLRE